MSKSDRRTALGAMLAIGAAGAISVPAQAKASHKPHALDLDKLMSRWSIEEILLDYARGMDRSDEALALSCFWPESTHKHGGFDGKSTAFIGFAAKIIAQLKLAAHHISNISVEVDGDRALTECYYHAYHVRDAKDGSGDEIAMFYGRYIDLFERRDGVWKIIRRRGLSDLTPAATPAVVPYSQWPEGTHSLHNTNDEYYTMRAAFRADK